MNIPRAQMPKRGAMTHGAQLINHFVIDFIEAIKTLGAGSGGYTIVSSADIMLSTLYFNALFHNAEDKFGLGKYSTFVIAFLLSTACWAIQTMLVRKLVQRFKKAGWSGLFAWDMLLPASVAGFTSLIDSVLDTIPAAILVHDTPPTVFVPDNASLVYYCVAALLFSLSAFSDVYQLLFKGTHDEDVQERSREYETRMLAIRQDSRAGRVVPVVMGNQSPSTPRTVPAAAPAAVPAAAPAQAQRAPSSNQPFVPDEVIRVDDLEPSSSQLTPAQQEAHRVIAQQLMEERTQRFRAVSRFSDVDEEE